MGKLFLSDTMMAEIISRAILEHGLNMIVNIVARFDVSPGPRNGVNLSQEQRQEIVDLIREETFTKTGR